MGYYYDDIKPYGAFFQFTDNMKNISFWQEKYNLVHLRTSEGQWKKEKKEKTAKKKQ